MNTTGRSPCKNSSSLSSVISNWNLWFLFQAFEGQSLNCAVQIKVGIKYCYSQSLSLVYISKQSSQHQNKSITLPAALYPSRLYQSDYWLLGFQSIQAKVTHNFKNAAIQSAPANPTQDLLKKPPQTAPTNNNKAPVALLFRSALSVSGAVKSLASLIMSQYKLVNTTVGMELNLSARLATI